MTKSGDSKAPDNFAVTRWPEQFFWPFGRTSKGEFGRGWLMVVLGQIILVLAGLALLSSRISLAGIVLVFSGLFIGSWMIWVLHIRRLHDNGRSGWCALFVLVPILVAIMVMVPKKRSGQQLADNPWISQQLDKDAAKIDRAKAQKRKSRRAMRAKRPGGSKRAPNVLLMKTGASVAAYSVFAMLMSLLSLIVFQRMPSTKGVNRWNDSS